MPTVNVDLGERSYQITIQEGLMDRAGEVLAGLARRPKVAIVTQRRVWELWGDRLTASLSAARVTHTVHQVPNGEGAKNIAWLRRLYGEFARNGVDRTSMVAAFGGGAVGDLAGFAAASWLRGVDFVQIPTTLLAQVDASVGGKVGINLPFGKNLVGAFWQPKAVLIDPGALRSLPRRDLRSGLAEVIKYGIILDTGFFRFVARSRSALLSLDGPSVEQAIRRSCELKAYVVCNDEREAGLRAVLNYGHTVGHGLEAAAKYSRIRHGEGVAIGMVLAARLAARLGMLDHESVNEIQAVIRDYGLPVEVPRDLDVEAIMGAMTIDKKAMAGHPRFVLPDRIGHVEITDRVTLDMVVEVIRQSQSGLGPG